MPVALPAPKLLVAPAAPASTGIWSFLACDALSGQVLTELPLLGPSLSHVLNGNGDLTGAVQLDGQKISQVAIMTNADPGSVSIFASRDGVLEWGGLLWTAEYASDSTQLQLTANEFGSYLGVRWVPPGTYTGDIATLAAGWISAAFADGGPALTTAVTTTGTVTTVPVEKFALQYIADQMSVFSSQIGGFDWVFDCVAGGANQAGVARLVISYPRRGQNWRDSGVVLDYPGPVTKWGVKKDATRMATDLVVTGGGTGTAQLRTEVQTPIPGYVKTQLGLSRPDLLTQAQVDAYTPPVAATLAAGAPRLYTAEVRGEAVFNAGLSVGDEITLAIRDPYFPNGGLLLQRILAMRITPLDGTNPELATLTLGPVL